jgi:choline dehydrogenase-like flavoprotein
MELVRLLLRSAATDAACPFSNNRNIGQGFVDHLHGVGGRVLDADRRRLRSLFETRFSGGMKISTKIRASDDFVRRYGYANCAASVISRGSLTEYASDTLALVRRIVRAPSGADLLQSLRRSSAMGRVLLPMAWNYLVKRRGYNLIGDELLVGLEIEQLPTPQSRLFLDPDQPPKHARIGVDWRVDGGEIASVQAFCARFKAFMESSGLGKVVIDERIMAADPAFFDDCRDAFHHMGGARMGTTSREGVVDPNLRVFGTDNLWAAGAAVFPSGSFANPTVTALALAHRLCDKLVASVDQRQAVGA